MARKVREAERALPYTYDRGKEIALGADGTPTSSLDKLAEDAILEVVMERDLPFNILSEEAGMINRGKDRTLVIDPIDGTQNAIMGVPFYSVSLALGTKSMKDVEVALVQNLVTGDTYYAEKGMGAYLNGARIRVRSCSPQDIMFLMYMGLYSAPETFQIMKRARRSRALGCASLEMCLVAEGRADAYYINCDVYEKAIRVVDIAASALVLREAGGEIVSLDGRSLDMGFNLKERSNYLAYGDEKIRKVVM